MHPQPMIIWELTIHDIFVYEYIGGFPLTKRETLYVTWLDFLLYIPKTMLQKMEAIILKCYTYVCACVFMSGTCVQLLSEARRKL